MNKSKPAPKSAAQLRQWEEGQKYECVHSTSPGYKVGRHYTVYKNDKGILCLKGSDGFEDHCSMLISGFKRVTLNETVPEST